ncbi:MAG: RNA 3'-terminal phosphate cyclase [Planctomycetota bacterium]|jgi:RNA 3'-terminal phosphate cyclase (ATP)
METVFIDGSAGEGGGQILRTSLALACITGKSLHIDNIRAARRNPGLAKQHLSCVRAVCQICGGQCRGAALRSGVLDFQPGPMQSGDFHFDIGSAGSASLVIQTVLPALFLADKPSVVTVIGGTHNPLAPPFDFLSETFLPTITTAGFKGNCKLIKHGFYPGGGGKITFDVQMWQKSTDRIINFCELGKESQIHARIYTAKLPPHIAQRQRKLLLQSGLDIRNVEHVEVTDSDGPGNCVMIRLLGGERTTVFTAFGMRGKPSQQVISEVVNLAEDFLSSRAAVDCFLADQLLIYLAITKAGSFTTNELSSHLKTNMEVIKKFLPVNFRVEQQNQLYKISC